MNETVFVKGGSIDKNTWTPVVGQETLDFLKRKKFIDSTGAQTTVGIKVKDQALSILRLCGNPGATFNSSTGMVLGYVQSGKTLSFTTLTALARDNDYQIVIIIAGTSVNLLNQSTDRMKEDLNLEDRPARDQKWKLFTNPRINTDKSDIEITLSQWKKEEWNNRRKSLLITVMKNGSHLKSLVGLFKKLDLAGVPTLIIDDEGDQASLNTRARIAAAHGRGSEDWEDSDLSTIYRRMKELKEVFPNHTFLQYTATPQANLFIDVLDQLSPKFIRRLIPGDEYVGGKTFFKKGSPYVLKIPEGETFDESSPPVSPPDSLLDAMRIFYLGIAWENCRGTPADVRSMLVHPSRLQDDHSIYRDWISGIVKSWIRRLSDPEGSEDRKELLDEFKSTYEDLNGTLESEIPFEEIVKNGYLSNALQFSKIKEVNSRNGRTPSINWKDEESWLLIGGQSMDRGFTVEGLTVTYMPRGVGTGNVDTIQQRARFFGYKKKYLGLCRIYLPSEVIGAYRDIVGHEEDLWSRLKDFDENSKTLTEWKREVRLDGSLSLTRANVIGPELERSSLENGWYLIRSPHIKATSIEKNFSILQDFWSNNKSRFSEDVGHPDRTIEQRHSQGDFTLFECLRDVLSKLEFETSNIVPYDTLLDVLSKKNQDNPNIPCHIYYIGAGRGEWLPRKRKLEGERIQRLFQGRNPSAPEVYPGDGKIKGLEGITIQIHLLNIKQTDYRNVPTLAIWIPEGIGMDLISHA